MNEKPVDLNMLSAKWLKPPCVYIAGNSVLFLMRQIRCNIFVSCERYWVACYALLSGICFCHNAIFASLAHARYWVSTLIQPSSVNSLWPSAIWRRATWAALVQVMTYRPLGTFPLPKYIMLYYQLTPKEQTSVKFGTRYNRCHSKMHLKIGRSSVKCRPCVQTWLTGCLWWIIHDLLLMGFVTPILLLS